MSTKTTYMHYKKDNKENNVRQNNSSIQESSKSYQSNKSNISINSSQKIDAKLISPTQSQLEATEATQVCKFHQKKKAKYKIINVPIFHPGIKQKYSLCDQVCSKCAVNLVAMGYKVEETHLDLVQQRQEEIQTFLQQVQCRFDDIDVVEQQLMEKRDELQFFTERQQERVKDYYQKLISRIECQMQENFCKLDDSHQRLFQHYEDKIQELKDNHSDLLQMYSDIEVNIEGIITGIDQLPYKQIMGQYTKRVSTIQQTIRRFEQDQICLCRVYIRKPNEGQLVLGGLLEDTSLDIRQVQTNLIKKNLKIQANNTTQNVVHQCNSRILYSPTPSTGMTSQIQYEDNPPTPQRKDMQQKSPKSSNVKQRSLSQPTYGAQKYLDILQKVNENQIKTNYYYTTLLQQRKQSQTSDFLNQEETITNLLSLRTSQHQDNPFEQVGKQYYSPKFK